MFIFQNGGFTLARIVGNVNVGNDNVGNGKYKESEGGKKTEPAPALVSSYGLLGCSRGGI